MFIKIKEYGMKRYINSDLAVEKRGIFNLQGVDSAEYYEEEKEHCTVCKLNISNKQLSEKYGRKEGRYVTVFFDEMSLINKRSFTSIAEVLSCELKAVFSVFCKKNIDKCSVLVAGLGNSALIVDALGPLTIEKVIVTRHIKSAAGMGISEVSAITPGVLSRTGIETAELVKVAAQSVNPDVIIVVDSLCAASCDRLGTTVQISDCGIIPGSGVGNVRKAITKENIGYPIISIGIPTVVSSSTLIIDALEKAGVNELSDELVQVLKDGKSFFVCPRECEEIVELASNLIASALNLAFGTTHKCDISRI